MLLGSGPVGDDDIWYHHREFFIFSEPAKRKLQHWKGLGELGAGRALEPAERASEPAERASETGGRPREGGTETERERQTEQSILGMWWYHMSSSPMGPLPKRSQAGAGARSGAGAG